MKNKYDSIAIVGATGLVGTTLLALLQETVFPFKALHLIASDQSVGKTLVVKDKHYLVQDLADFDFQKTQIAFFCVSSHLSEVYALKAVRAGNLVIDKSDHFRNHPDIPLVIPEVNANALLQCKKACLIASPNCNTIPIAIALKPIYDAVGIKRINVSTYQSVSGTGKRAIDELTEQTKQILEKRPIEFEVYPQQIAFNVLPHIDLFEENGYTREEMKIVWEMQKIFNDTDIAINPTAVRVPVYYGHAASIHLETRDKITAEEAMALFAESPAMTLMTGKHPYPTPARDAAGKDLVFVGRVREDISHPTGLNLWVVTDNLRKGAALNALHIATHFLSERTS
ncbi:MAG: Aspartate-semialdehyde dehydrogenase [uncultured bacterium]|nr:MAG: Aspartate-semialdehyde dehydrogenase [uncultured bacterium]OGT54094.1 MAG: aspartate-semialdehyde dehydrogenase [Gammaproteobacteria bacterium RIFCSPHIGHO2_12_FULL_42_10]